MTPGETAATTLADLVAAALAPSCASEDDEIFGAVAPDAEPARVCPERRVHEGNDAMLACRHFSSEPTSNYTDL